MNNATATKAATAVSYSRVSTVGQATERNVSLEVQEDAFRRYFQANNLTRLAAFTDVASGRKDDRPQYRAMLEYVAKNHVGTVVVLFLDRFGRNPREILRQYWELQERGTTVESISEDLKEELLLLVRAGMAGAESRRISERVSMAHLKAATKGRLVNRLPYGLTKLYDTEGKSEVVQVPKEAAVIREAYELAIANRGFKAIADELNLRGHRTKAGKLWATQTIKLILTNPATAGHFVFKGSTETVERRDAYPAILDADEWERLQERLAIRREHVRGKSGKSNYLLSGTLRCGHCGGAMAGTSKGQEGKYRYYFCANRKMAAAYCAESVSYRKERLEAAVLEYLGQYADPAIVREMLQAQEVETDNRAEGELATITARLAQLEQAFLNDLDRVDREVLTEAEYLKRQEVRRQEQERLAVRKEDLEAVVAAQRDLAAQATAVPLKVGSFLEEFGNMDVPRAKAALQTVLKAAHIYSDGTIELEFRA